MLIVEQNEICKKYNFSSLISNEDKTSAISNIEKLVNEGKYFHNTPNYQTNENLFSGDNKWLKFKQSFLFSAFDFIGREVEVENLNAWSYMTNLSTVVNRDTYWHNHNNNQWKNKISGVFYVHIPSNIEQPELAGTEFAPNGPNDEETYFVTPSEFTWLIFPGTLWHRPGIVQSDEYRYIIAADMEYR